MKMVMLVLSVCFLLAFIIPAVASDGDPIIEPEPGIPWGLVITSALGLIAALAGGVVAGLRNALVASHKAMKILSDALEDNAISDDEIKSIVTASVNCSVSWKAFGVQLKELIARR